MREDARTTKTPDIAYVQGYHSGNHGEAPVNYAFRGFDGNYYFNSDRKEKLVRGADGLFYREGGQQLAGFGLEIETECSTITKTDVLADVFHKIIFPVFKFGADMFKMQSDISLGGSTSVEVITQVMTKTRIRNDYHSYKTMFDHYFKAFGISADSYTTSCGMHVNVSLGVFGKTKQQQDEAIRKLFYIVNKYYDVFVRAFKRDPRKTRWCGRMDYSTAKTMDLNNMPSSHGNCMNYSHYPEGRIEIRLVGGQADYYSFRNTMETVFFLTERVRNISWKDCDDLVKIFTGCNNYVFKRLPDCGLTDDQLRAIRETVKAEDLELRRD